MQQDKDKIEELITSVIGNRTIVEVKRMGGLTNRTYYVLVNDENTGMQQELVVRLPGEGTEDMIVRSDEEKSVQLACALDIDAPLHFFDSKTGEKVTDYIVNSETMHASELRKDENIIRMAEIMSRLHSCGINTGVAFDVIDMAETYEKVIRKGGGFFYDDYAEVKTYVDQLKTAYMPNVKKVPCHNDALCENWILQNGEKMYLIDWEYAGMNDPMWDMADLSIECDMTRPMEELLLRTYFGREATGSEWKAFGINKVLIDYLWSLWGKTRAVYDGEELEKYAFDRWVRMRGNMETLKG